MKPQLMERLPAGRQVSEHNPSISLEDYVLSAVEGHKLFG
jgi:hypothetical protein